MKKILLTIGSIGATVAPIATVVACGDSFEHKISIKASENPAGDLTAVEEAADAEAAKAAITQAMRDTLRVSMAAKIKEAIKAEEFDKDTELTKRGISVYIEGKGKNKNMEHEMYAHSWNTLTGETNSWISWANKAILYLAGR